MAKELFTEIKKLKREIRDEKDRATAGRENMERFDQSLSLYMTTVPLLVLGAAITSANSSSVDVPWVEFMSWAFLLIAFLVALALHGCSSIQMHDLYDRVERDWERSEANQKTKIINAYIEREKDETIRSVLQEYLDDEQIKAEELAEPPDTYTSNFARKHQGLMDRFSEYGPPFQIFALMAGLLLLLVSRGISM